MCACCTCLCSSVALGDGVCVYEGISLVDAFKALGVLHRHQKLLSQVFKRLVRREVQTIKAEREENVTNINIAVSEYYQNVFVL